MYVSPNWRIRVYLNGTQIIDEVAAGPTSGGAALGGTSPKFDDLKVGYDINADGDLNNAGDDKLIDESFGSTDTTVTYD